MTDVRDGEPTDEQLARVAIDPIHEIWPPDSVEFAQESGDEMGAVVRRATYRLGVLEGLASAHPPMVTTLEELAALAVGSIIFTASGMVACRWDETRFTRLGDERAFETWGNLSLPARLLLDGSTVPDGVPIKAAEEP